MAKVIVERPRIGGGVRFPRAEGPDDSRLSIEDWRSREGVRRPWHRSSCRKHLNENLTPLRRYLRSNVGRPWNKVYSEICQQINRDSAVQLHVWQHLMQDVCTNPYVITGEVRRYSVLNGYYFYVDPRSGLLREAPPFRWKHLREKTEAPDDRIVIDESHEFRRIDGIWYELELAPLPPDRLVFDHGTRRECRGAMCREMIDFYGRPVYAIRKRQLNKKELRRIRGPEVHQNPQRVS